MLATIFFNPIHRKVLKDDDTPENYQQQRHLRFSRKTQWLMAWWLEARCRGELQLEVKIHLAHNCLVNGRQRAYNRPETDDIRRRVMMRTKTLHRWDDGFFFKKDIFDGDFLRRLVCLWHYSFLSLYRLHNICIVFTYIGGTVRRKKNENILISTTGDGCHIYIIISFYYYYVRSRVILLSLQTHGRLLHGFVIARASAGGICPFVVVSACIITGAVMSGLLSWKTVWRYTSTYYTHVTHAVGRAAYEIR